MNRAREVLLGAALLRLLGLIGREAPQGGAYRLGRADQPFATDAPRNPKLLGASLGCFAVGAFIMLLFHGDLARVVGVVLMVAFVVTGLFLVADPRWLAGEDDPPDT